MKLNNTRHFSLSGHLENDNLARIISANYTKLMIIPGIFVQVFAILILVLSFSACRSGGEQPKHSLDRNEIQKLGCIEHVLKSDSILGGIRNHASEHISLSETINNYTGELKSLDFTNCPEEFRSAFDQHMDAWNDMIRVTDKYPGLRGEMHAIFGDLERSADSTEFKILLKQIWDTWGSVEQSSK
jgi:hypothetical protein